MNAQVLVCLSWLERSTYLRASPAHPVAIVFCSGLFEGEEGFAEVLRETMGERQRGSEF